MKVDLRFSISLKLGNLLIFVEAQIFFPLISNGRSITVEKTLELMKVDLKSGLQNVYKIVPEISMFKTLIVFFQISGKERYTRKLKSVYNHSKEVPRNLQS